MKCDDYAEKHYSDEIEKQAFYDILPDTENYICPDIDQFQIQGVGGGQLSSEFSFIVKLRLGQPEEDLKDAYVFSLMISRSFNPYDYNGQNSLDF